MTNKNVSVDGNGDTPHRNLRNLRIREVNENSEPNVGSKRKSESSEHLQYYLATERNRLRWELEKTYEKDATEAYLNEDSTVKQRRFIQQAVKMSEVVLDIQEALHSGIDHDIPKAIENLKKLIEMPFSTFSLLYAPCIVKTVYLCCTYEESSEIRTLAEKCYARFEPCFGVPEGETFETSFQARVKEFWEKQSTVIFDSTKYNWEQFTMDKDTSTEATKIDDDTKTEKKMNKIETKVGCKVKREIDDKTKVKDELKQELLDKNTIKKEKDIKQEKYDDKSLVKKEAKYECKTDAEICAFDGTVIKKEILDDNLEITCCGVFKSENIPVLPRLSVNLEPVDFNKLNAEYDSDKDCYILN